MFICIPMIGSSHVLSIAVFADHIISYVLCQIIIFYAIENSVGHLPAYQHCFLSLFVRIPSIFCNIVVLITHRIKTQDFRKLLILLSSLFNDSKKQIICICDQSIDNQLRCALWQV